MAYLLHSLCYLATTLAAFLLTFLLVQKPLFMAYHWRRHRLSAKDVAAVYSHGLQLDLAAAGYLAMLPIVLTALSQLFFSQAVVLVLLVYGVLSALLLALAAAADAVLYGFWDSKLDASVLMYLNSPGKLSSVSRTFLLLSVALFVLLAALTGALTCSPLLLLPEGAELEPVSWWWRVAAALAVLAVGAAVFVFLIWGGARRHGRKASKPNSPAKAFFSSDPYLNHAALNPFYNFIYTLSYRRRLDREFRFMTDEEAEEGYRRYLLDNGGRSSQPTVATQLLNTQRPNVLLMIMESYGSPFVKSLGGHPDTMPCLEQLIGEGIFFSQCYCSSIRTDRAIVAMESGYPGQPTYSVIKVSGKTATLPGLPKTLRREGYDTSLYHGGDLRIFNKYEYYQLCGHTHLYSIDDFDPSERLQRWGVPDHIVMERMTDDIVRRRREQPGQPWMMSMQTLSSHLPYDVPWKILDDEVLNCYAYTDRALGQMIDRLKADPEVWSNLLVIIMADHGMPYKELKNHTPGFAHVPWLMVGGAVKEPMRVDKVVSQTDLPATVLAMMGLSHDEFQFSRDVFSSAYRYPCAFNTYNNGLMFRDAEGCTIFDNTQQAVTNDPDARREHAGKAILQYLYADLDRRGR